MTREEHYVECMQFVTFCNLENRLDESPLAPSLLREYALGHTEVGDPDAFVTDIRSWRRRQIPVESPRTFYTKKAAVIAALLDKYREAGALWQKLGDLEAAAVDQDEELLTAVSKSEDDIVATVLWLLDEQAGVAALAGT